jgi:uncharacterized protein (TIGR02246 family)
MTETGNEAQIRALNEEWAEAIRTKDPVALMSRHTPDALLFDLIDPLQYVGKDAATKRAEQWLSSFEGPVSFEYRDLAISAGDGVAFSHSLNHVAGTTVKGQEISMWWRATVCYRKIEGTWRVTHEHCSVPFDMESGIASLQLEP